MNTTVTVSILGHEFKIRGDEEEERILDIADYVNEKILEVQKNTSTLNTLNIVILAALNIAADYFKAVDENEDTQRQVDERARKLIEYIRDNV